MINPKTERNGEIDLFRFVFAMVILVGHACHTFNFKTLQRSGISTEFFFLVTGCLMAKKASANKNELSMRQIADNTWFFVQRKIKVFFSYYIMAFTLLIPFALIIRKWTLTKLIKELLSSLPAISLTFIGWGVRGSLCLWGSWYLSAMLIAYLILYPLLLKNYHITTKILFPIIGMFLVQYNYKSYLSITPISQTTTFITGGLIRGISEIAIGASIYELSLKLKALGSRKLVSLFATCIKFFSYTVTILYAIKFHNFMTDIDYLLWLIIAVSLSFSGVGFVINESSVTRYLGKISLPIYIFHMLVISSAYGILGETNIAIFILVIIFSILFSISLMYVTDFFAKKIKMII